MERLKALLVRHFERILVTVIVVAAVTGTYFVDEKLVMLNFFYLPVLVAGYFLGRRYALLVSIFCILAVIFLAITNRERFVGDKETTLIIPMLAAWGGFLILAGIAVGTLYELSERRYQDLKKAYIGVLEIMTKYLESTDRYTKGHSVRVSELAMDTAAAMGLHKNDVENVRVAALLHDIGKIEISGDLLSKAAELSDDERNLIAQHPEKGAKILAAVGAVLKEAVPIVYAHHKYFTADAARSGHAFPEVPLGARIVAVADAFDAMTTDRPYRKGVTGWQALDELKVNTPKQFDPEVIKAFELVVSDRMEKI